MALENDNQNVRLDQGKFAISVLHTLARLQASADVIIGAQAKAIAERQGVETDDIRKLMNDDVERLTAKFYDQMTEFTFDGLAEINKSKKD